MSANSNHPSPNARASSKSRRLFGWLLGAGLAVGGTASIGVPLASAQSNAQQQGAARLAAVQAARGRVDAARSALQAAATRVRANWESQPQLLQAQKELTDARAELDRVSKPILQKLQQSDEYKRAVAEEDDAAQRVSAEQAKTAASQPAATMPSTQPAAGTVGAGLRADDPNGTATADQTDLNVAMPSDDQVDAAADRLQTTSKRRQLEEAAIRADNSTADARARVEKASAQVRGIRLQERAAVLNDSDYKAAQQQLDEARAELARASSQNF